MKFTYVALLTLTNSDMVLVEVPDLEILTEGYGVADATEMAKDAIKLMLEYKIDHKENIPQPTECDKVNIENGTFYKDNDTTIKVPVTVWLNERSD
ncbi:MAG TPA: hypothetical protein DCW90_16760 [Lachnospiraceae bacterium]|nr:hypothetical protein [Lachnospiraceae bacterium]